MSASRLNQHLNRESWLNDVASRLRPAFTQLGAPLPERLRIAIGFPSTGRRAKAKGECWDSTASAHATFEILIRPDLAEDDGAIAMPVVAALAHELVHAAVGIRAGKGPVFRRVALGIGLIGPMRATAAGPAFIALAAPILEAVGPLHTPGSRATNGLSTPIRRKTRRSAPAPASRPAATSNALAPSAATSPAPADHGSTRPDRLTAPCTDPCRQMAMRQPHRQNSPAGNQTNPSATQQPICSRISAARRTRRVTIYDTDKTRPRWIGASVFAGMSQPRVRLRGAMCETTNFSLLFEGGVCFWAYEVTAPNTTLAPMFHRREASWRSEP